METNDFCVDCGEPTANMRCAPCQRKHNLELQAEHDSAVRSRFQSERRSDGRGAKTPMPAASRVESSTPH